MMNLLEGYHYWIFRGACRTVNGYFNNLNADRKLNVSFCLSTLSIDK